MTGRRTSVRIGGASGFWGDSAFAPAQLVAGGRLDYLVSDYLAEISMSLLARARAKDATAGFVPDFVETLAPLLREVRARGIRVVTNAGGVNPDGCRAALERAAAAAGVPLRVAVVGGDDLLSRENRVRAAAPRELSSGAPLPPKLQSCNAYLGARPIARALDLGADVVITGRCADSAVTLGVLLHEFGWPDDAYDALAAGSLAGHVIECGPQCTGGVFTDWERVPGWEDMGYPVIDCAPDGSFEVTKPDGTGGLVDEATVAEQVLYEIGDPTAYVLPDVVCDFSGVSVREVAPGRVAVRGARGRPPTPTAKVSATYADGWRIVGTVMVAGHQAAGKARRMGAAIVERTRVLNRRLGRPDWRETSVEVIGSGDTYGPSRADPESATEAREVVLKIGLRCDDRAALETFAREMTQAGVAMAQGTTGLFGGRPTPSPVVRLYSFLWPKSELPVWVEFGGERHEVAWAPGRPLDAEPSASGAAPPPLAAPAPPSNGGATRTVPLIRVAHGRSGDKGNDANIGVRARAPRFVPVLRAQLTAERVRAFFAHAVDGPVERFELPGLDAFNFTLREALGGGGVASLRYDPQGKAFAQMLMDLPIEVPAALLGGG